MSLSLSGFLFLLHLNKATTEELHGCSPITCLGACASTSNAKGGKGKLQPPSISSVNHSWPQLLPGLSFCSEEMSVLTTSNSMHSAAPVLFCAHLSQTQATRIVYIIPDRLKWCVSLITGEKRGCGQQGKWGAVFLFGS